MDAKKPRVPKGTKFLPGTGIQKLKNLHRSEENPKAKDRLLACIMRKEGAPLRKIGSSLNVPHTTIADWLHRVAANGISGRYDEERPGRQCRLDEKQLERLRSDLIAGPQACGFESGLWTSPMVVQHVRKLFGTDYEPRGIRDLLHRIGFSWRTARPKHPKSASKRRQRAFKKKARQIAADHIAMGYSVFAYDESSHVIGHDIKHGWYVRGDTDVTTQSHLSRQRFHSYGALNQRGFRCRFYDNLSTDNFIDFLLYMYAEFGNILLFVDNAAYHKSIKLMRFLEEMNGKIILEYFLPYTPELNPVEQQWRIVKARMAGRIHGTTEEAKEMLRRMLMTGEIRTAKMYDYLTP